MDLLTSLVLVSAVHLNVNCQNPAPLNINGGYVYCHMDTTAPENTHVSFPPISAQVRRWMDGVSWVQVTEIAWAASSDRMYMVYSFPSSDGWDHDQQVQIMIPPFDYYITKDGTEIKAHHSEIKIFGWIK